MDSTRREPTGLMSHLRDLQRATASTLQTKERLCSVEGGMLMVVVKAVTQRTCQSCEKCLVSDTLTCEAWVQFLDVPSADEAKLGAELLFVVSKIPKPGV